MSQASPATSFKERYKRIQCVTGTRTQMELAAFLCIRQSSVADAKRRNAIPYPWLVKLMLRTNANPEWLLSGTGPQFLDGQASACEETHEGTGDMETLRRVSSRALAQELLRRVSLGEASP